MPRVIITVTNQTPQPYRFQLDRKEVHLGRGSDNDIIIDCRSISSRHAVMERIPGGYQLRDLDSTNGTKIHNKRQAVIPLSNGLAVKLGDVSFDFTLTADEVELLASEQVEEEQDSAESVIETEDPAPIKNKLPQAGAELPPPQRPVLMVAPASFSQNILAVFVFLIFAAIAFYIGLSIRHQKETNQSLLQSLSNKNTAVTPATADETNPADTKE